MGMGPGRQRELGGYSGAPWHCTRFPKPRHARVAPGSRARLASRQIKDRITDLEGLMSLQSMWSSESLAFNKCAIPGAKIFEHEPLLIARQPAMMSRRFRVLDDHVAVRIPPDDNRGARSQFRKPRSAVRPQHNSEGGRFFVRCSRHEWHFSLIGSRCKG